MGCTAVATFSQAPSNAQASSGPAISTIADPSELAEPINAAATMAAIKVKVASAGIQHISGAALAAAGFDLANTLASRLHLEHDGQEIAIEIRGAANDRLTTASEVRFYAPQPGDRWNAVDIYWLTVQATAGQRMAAAAITPASGAAHAVGIERGLLTIRKVYNSLEPGLSGDHWYAAQLAVSSATPQPMFAVVLPATLAPVGGTAVVSVSGLAATGGQRSLRAQTAAGAMTATWAGAGVWTQTFTLPTLAGSRLLTLTLSAPAADTEFIDQIVWQLPVSLNFAGQGGGFRTTGASRYQLSNIPVDRALYDVANPLAPRVQTIPAGTSVLLESDAQPRQFILAGQGSLFTPALSPYSPVDLSTLRDGEVVYIAPPSLRPALAPLIALRQSQGLGVRVIEPQWIYDAWSFGRTSPEAIRSFLRNAYRTWARAPRYVTLVGDGTLDPLGLADPSANNLAANVIPPYLARVDPTTGETACETCYGQLDGVDPLSDSVPDIAIARLPAKSAAELTVMVNKIVAYETASTAGAAWRSRVGFVSDNVQDENGQIDGAGDFNALLEMAVALQPSTMAVERVYYDPYLPSASSAPWRKANALTAYTQTLQLFNNGAGIIEMAGHGHPLQFASTAQFTHPVENTPAGYLMSSRDPARLTNAGRSPIVLLMACDMGRFHATQPTPDGQTLSERLLASPNGAVAVWAASGKGQLWGHQYLQRGFYTTLWGATPLTARLGDLTLAGQRDLVANADFLTNMSWTYVTLGDAAMQVRVAPVSAMSWPRRLLFPRIYR